MVINSLLGRVTVGGFLAKRFKRVQVEWKKNISSQ